VSTPRTDGGKGLASRQDQEGDGEAEDEPQEADVGSRQAGEQLGRQEGELRVGDGTAGVATVAAELGEAEERRQRHREPSNADEDALALVVDAIVVLMPAARAKDVEPVREGGEGKRAGPKGEVEQAAGEAL